MGISKPPKHILDILKGVPGLRIPGTCAARTRKGTLCLCKPVDGKNRCKFHGGKSTGPKTLEGRARIAESNRLRAEARRQERAKTRV
ncbi:MAG: HGGxSTG domain-containing protein [Armatimonadota bacterium]